MKHPVLTLFLCLAAGSAGATFEIADPANDMYKEWQAAPRADEEQPLDSGPFCVVDSELDKCWCFDRNSGDQLDLSPEECRDRAAARSEAEDR